MTVYCEHCDGEIVTDRYRVGGDEHLFHVLERRQDGTLVLIYTVTSPYVHPPKPRDESARPSDRQPPRGDGLGTGFIATLLAALCAYFFAVLVHTGGVP